MRKERILLLGGNFYPEPTGIGKYNGEMIDWLSFNGYECGVVTTYPYYPYWKIQAPHINKSYWYRQEQRCTNNAVPIQIYRCPHYVPAIPCGKKRVYSDISFFFSAFFQVIILLFKKKYDYVITVAPPFQLGLLGLFYKMIKGAKLIYHNQDLQIDAAYELGMIKSKTLVRLMFALEKYILRKADYVSSISDGMIRKLTAKYDRAIIQFPNWADTKSFYPILNKLEFKKQYNFSANDKIALYSGAIGEKQGLQTLINSAENLRQREDIKFIICGSGPYKQNLVDMVEEKGLSNVLFMPLQPRENFNQFLNIADLHLVLQKANANDLMMPSKLTTILSVGGLVLVTAESGTSLHTLISTNQMGLIIEPENQAALTSSILAAIDQPHTDLKENARKYAEDQLAVDKVVSNFFSQITGSESRVCVKRRQKEPLQMDINTN